MLDNLERLIILKKQQYESQEAEYKLRSAQLAKLRQDQEDESRARLSAFIDALTVREEDVKAREKVNASVAEFNQHNSNAIDEKDTELAVKSVRLENWENNLKETARKIREDEARIAGMRDEAQTFRDEASEAWEENKSILKKTKEDFGLTRDTLSQLRQEAIRTAALTEMERNGFLQWKAETEKRIEEKERELDIKLKTATQLYGKNE